MGLWYEPEDPEPGSWLGVIAMITVVLAGWWLIASSLPLLP